MLGQVNDRFVINKNTPPLYLFGFKLQIEIRKFAILQAQSDDDDVGPDDVAVNVEGRDGFMDAFFAEVSNSDLINQNNQQVSLKGLYSYP